MMARTSYYVTNYQGQWHVKVGDNRYGPYRTQADAIAQARAWATANQPSQILVQGADGRFRTEWTYGNDPFPPRG